MSESASSLTFNSWIMLFVIGLLIFLMNIDYTAVNLALVPISEEIHGDLNVFQWLLSGYVLIWAALVVPAGRFADIYEKNPSYWGLPSSSSALLLQELEITLGC